MKSFVEMRKRSLELKIFHRKGQQCRSSFDSKLSFIVVLIKITLITLLGLLGFAGTVRVKREQPPLSGPAAPSPKVSGIFCKLIGRPYFQSHVEALIQFVCVVICLPIISLVFF